MKNTSLMAEFRYRPIKMFLTHHSTSIIKRGQHRIPHLTTISSRGHYQYPHRTLINLWGCFHLCIILFTGFGKLWVILALVDIDRLRPDCFYGWIILVLNFNDLMTHETIHWKTFIYPQKEFYSFTGTRREMNVNLKIKTVIKGVCSLCAERSCLKRNHVNFNRLELRSEIDLHINIKQCKEISRHAYHIYSLYFRSKSYCGVFIYTITFKIFRIIVCTIWKHLVNFNCITCIIKIVLRGCRKDTHHSFALKQSVYFNSKHKTNHFVKYITPKVKQKYCWKKSKAA